MNWMDILERLKQPSSFAGYAAILVIVMQLLGRPLPVDADTLSNMTAHGIFVPIGQVIAGIFALVAIFKHEAGAKKQ